MNSRLINVRLDERRLQRARKLRASGIALSDLVRDAIDRRYEQLVQSSKSQDLEAIVKQIYEECPDPPDLPPRNYDASDRIASKRAFVRKLRKARR